MHDAQGDFPLADNAATGDGRAPGQPLVSLVVTAYNIAPYLEECIRSIQAQTHANLEIVIVDDCSSDSSAEIAQSLAAQDKRITLVRKSKNEGALYAKLDGIRYSTGSYFLLCDGDDWLSPHAVTTCLRHIHGCDCVIFDINFVDHTSRTPHPNLYPAAIREKIARGQKLSNFEWASINHMMQLYFYDARVKQDFLAIYSGYPPLPYYEELPGFALTMSFNRVKPIPDLLYQYRLNRPGQSTENWWHLKRSVKYLSLDTAIATTTRNVATASRDVQEIVFFKLLKIAFAEYRGILMHNVKEFPRLRNALLEILGKIGTPRHFFLTSPKAFVFLLALKLSPPSLVQLAMPRLLKMARL